MFQESRFSVVAIGRSSFSGDESATIRSCLQSELAAEKRPSNLRNVDDQCIAGVLALRNAIAHCQLTTESMREWCVLAAPRSPGRTAMRTVIERFAREGAWCVSPHVIPNCSLHSLAGFLSVTMDLRGPNLGVGGWAGCESETWLAAIGLLAEPTIAGLWLVMTGWADDICRAIALGIQANAADCSCEVFISHSQTKPSCRLPVLTLESLDRILALGAEIPIRSQWKMPGDTFLELRQRSLKPRMVAA